MNKTRVFGIGSPFGDDQVGKYAVDLINTNKLLSSHLAQIDIEFLDRPGLYLIEKMKNADIVYLIDAILGNQQTGAIHRLNKEDLLAKKVCLSTHNIGVAEAIQLGNTLSLLPARIILYGIEINNATYSVELSPEIKQACHSLTKSISNELIRCFV